MTCQAIHAFSILGTPHLKSLGDGAEWNIVRIPPISDTVNQLNLAAENSSFFGQIWVIIEGFPYVTMFNFIPMLNSLIFTAGQYFLIYSISCVQI